MTIFDFFPEQNGFWRGPISDLGIKIISYYKQPRIIKLLKLIKDILTIKPDILHGWHFHTNIYTNIIGRICNVPVRIGSIRENPKYWPNFYFYKLLSLCGLDLIVSNSSVSTSEAQSFIRTSLFGKPRIITIPNFVDIVDPKHEVLNKNNLSGKIKIIGVGRLSINKNWGLIIQACKTLLDQGIAIELSIAGDGPEKENLKNLISRLSLEKEVFLLGSIPDISFQFPKFDIFVLCSRLEGMPNVIMEASAAGLPVIATRVGGIQEIVEEGKTGLLIDDDNLEQLINKLRLLAKNKSLREQYAHAGKIKMKNEYLFEKFISEFIEVYSNLLNEKNTV